MADSSPAASAAQSFTIAPQTLEGVTLSAGTVYGLIKRYYTRLHNLFPILPEKEVFEAEHAANKLLLWTVLTLASFHGADDSATYLSLVEPVRRLAADLYGPQSRSFKTMQALLLLCIWPFPFQQTINDPSPMYAALATSIGYQSGLHRPQHRDDFDENTTMPVQSTSVETATWCGCFIVNHVLALRLGVPSAIEPGRAILVAATDERNVPLSLALDLNIALLSKQWLKVLGDDDAAASGLRQAPEATIQSFESQLTQLRMRFSGYRSSLGEISYYALQLQAYSFSISQQSDSVTDTTTTAHTIQAKAVSAVLQLISEAAQEDKLKKYWPASAKYAVVFAACIGIFIAATTTETMTKLSLLSACRDAATVMRGWSLFPKDQITRVATHITNAILRIESQHGLHAVPGPGKPAVISRMTANIPYRVLWSAKHGRAFSSSVNARATAAPATANDDTPQQDMSMYEDVLAMHAFDDLNDASFTDIFLDWQQLLDIG